MTNNIISEIVELPSKGLLYKPAIDPLIELRSMCAIDELYRLNYSDWPLRLMSNIINRCIVNHLALDTYDMCLPDYIYLLHKLRVVTYGPKYTASSVCPCCGHHVTREINLDQNQCVAWDNTLSDRLSLVLPLTKDKIKLAIQTPRMLDQIDRAPSPGEAFVLKLIYSIKTVNDKILEFEECEQYVKGLPLQDSIYILNKEELLLSMFGPHNKIWFDCPNCGSNHQVPFALRANFIDPLYDENGKSIAGEIKQKLLTQIYRIVQQSNFKYEDIMNMAYADRITVMQLLMGDMERQQETLHNNVHKLQ